MATQLNKEGINIGISWCDYTCNLWHGCTKVHQGCNNCYAEAVAKRFGNDIWGIDKPRLQIKSVWTDLLKYQKIAKSKNEIHRVFVGSMMDIFEKPMNVVDSKGDQVYCNSANTWKTDTGLLRNEFFNNIDLQKYENLMFLLLTKRPSNINKYIPVHWKTNPPKNVMFGTSPVDQETFDKLVPQLYQVQGKRFLSIEPQLDFIDIEKELPTGKGQLPYGLLMDWIIQGGESGPNKRPFNLEWAYSMKRQCEKFDIPYFFKQIDKVQPIPDDLLIKQFPVIV